ncbi:DUF1214 domain-containing protein [Kitasatospora griseola]|uniref:DUF1214 domain-containing protein n=1 Tax=Kitasatospora griseola TaxID=2064 RepID=UPI0038557107
MTQRGQAPVPERSWNERRGSAVHLTTPHPHRPTRPDILRLPPPEAPSASTRGGAGAHRGARPHRAPKSGRKKPENIYAIGRFAPPVADPGTGATTLYVQAEEPADSGMAAANWLPIPTSGNFSVTLRLYAPQTDDILADRPPTLTPVPAQD